MKQRNIAIVYGFVILALLTAAITLLVLKQRNQSTDLPRGLSREYSFKLVQDNNTSASCWVSFGAQVFDITRLLYSLEPAQKDELVKVCGTNLDTLPITIKTAEKLAQYQIGILAP